MKFTLSAFPITAVALALASPSVMAQDLSYNYVQASYLSVDLDDTEVDADGFAMGVSAKVADQVFVFAGYGTVESDSFTTFFGSGTVEVDTVTAGLGFINSLQPDTDLNLGLAFVRAKGAGTGDFSGSESENGYSLSAQLRHLFSASFEGRAGIDYTDIGDDDDTSFEIGGVVFLGPQFGIDLSYSVGSDADAWSAGLRLNF